MSSDWCRQQGSGNQSYWDTVNNFLQNFIEEGLQNLLQQHNAKSPILNEPLPGQHDSICAIVVPDEASALSTTRLAELARKVTGTETVMAEDLDPCGIRMVQTPPIYVVLGDNWSSEGSSMDLSCGKALDAISKSYD